MLQISAIEMLHATARFRSDGLPVDPAEPHLAAVRKLKKASRRQNIEAFRAKLALSLRKVSLAGRIWSGKVQWNGLLGTKT